MRPGCRTELRVGVDEVRDARRASRSRPAARGSSTGGLRSAPERCHDCGPLSSARVLGAVLAAGRRPVGARVRLLVEACTPTFAGQRPSQRLHDKGRGSTRQGRLATYVCDIRPYIYVWVPINSKIDASCGRNRYHLGDSRTSWHDFPATGPRRAPAVARKVAMVNPRPHRSPARSPRPSDPPAGRRPSPDAPEPERSACGGDRRVTPTTPTSSRRSPAAWP